MKRMNNAIRSRIITFVFVCVVFCFIITCWLGYLWLSRPLFSNHFECHPNSRPPWPKWWIMPPHQDQYGVTLRTDHQQNLILVFIDSQNDLILYPGYPNGPVIGDNGHILLWSKGKQSAVKQVCPFRINDARDQVFIGNANGNWSSLKIRSGLAETIDNQLDQRSLNNASIIDLLIAHGVSNKVRQDKNDSNESEESEE